MGFLLELGDGLALAVAHHLVGDGGLVVFLAARRVQDISVLERVQ